MKEGRALTPEQKRAVVERLYAAWLASPSQRLGQLTVNTMQMVVPEGGKELVSRLFYIEDETLIEKIEGFVAR